LRTLAGKGWIEPCRLVPATSPPPPGNPEQHRVTLNREQGRAVGAVADAFGRFRPFLLEGVTGSGKTEVYLRLIERALARQLQVLVLVPEIGLTPQLHRRLQRRIEAPLAVLHSGLPEGERATAWLRARDGQAAVLLGTRSAVFTPLPRLGLILVDEEHDLSFKQQDGFRYSARDVAVRRAQLQLCPVVLGTATPSLETLHNARSGRYGWLRLRERAGSARPPRLDLLDIRSQPLRAGLSPVLLRMMEEQLAAANQVLLFLNRRGYAPVLICHDCGWVAECPHCDARLTLHRSVNRLCCHHCGYQRGLISACAACGGADLRRLGQGTERLEGDLSELFPAVSLARIDRDSTRRKGEMERLLNAARQGEHGILLGTQMLAKGHHFPNVTLVGILDLDQGLYGTDYRASERMAQLLVQVAGRAGRAEKAGRVVVQTRHPDHPLLLTLIRQGYAAFAEEALRERASASLPPFSYQALLRAEASQPELAQRFLQEAQAAAAVQARGDVELWGPVPAPMERRAGRFRAQLLVQAPRRRPLQAFLLRWVPELYRLRDVRRVRWSVDVDPQEVL
jgi:primosomal protein N' (replication factor Y)